MGRIRSIKPEFPQSESVGRLSRDARLLFLQLFTLVDDEGRTRGASRMLASLLYPYDTEAAALIDGWLTELDREHIRRYSVEGQTYLEVINFMTHQKIDHPSKSKLPSFSNPRESSRILATDQGRDQGEDQEGRGNVREAAPPPPSVPIPELDLDDEEANIPDDLPAPMLGNYILQRLSIPHSPGLSLKFADCVDLLARDEGYPRGEAARLLIHRGRDHPPDNGKWRFWLEDGSWQAQAAQGISTEGWE